jgi:hypothetical protein
MATVQHIFIFPRCCTTHGISAATCDTIEILDTSIKWYMGDSIDRCWSLESSWKLVEEVESTMVGVASMDFARLVHEGGKPVSPDFAEGSLPRC